MAGPSGGDAHRGPAPVSYHHPRRSTRSWTSNGVHYTVDSTHYATPGLTLGAFSGTANGPLTFDPFMSSGRRPPPTFGLLGNAFGLLESALTMHPQHTVVADAGLGQGARRRVHVDTPSDKYDADLAYENDNFRSNRRARPKSIFSRLKDRLVDVKQHRSEDSSSSRERSSEEDRPRPPSRGHSRLRSETRQPAWEAPRAEPPEFIEVDYHDETDSEPELGPENARSRSRSRSRRHAALDDSMMAALESAVEVERRNVRHCKQKLAHASRQNNISSNHLQRIIDEMKQHESTLAVVTSNLHDYKARQTGSRPAEMPPREHSRSRSRSRPGLPPRQKSHDASRSHPSRNMGEPFADPLDGFPAFAGFPDYSRHPDPVFQAFQNLRGMHADPAMSFDPFDHFFDHGRPSAEHAQFRVFSMPGEPSQAGAVPNGPRKRTRHSTDGARLPFPHLHPASGTNYTRLPRQTSVAPPQPPATVLRPDEAQRLFQTYNERWNKLSPTSPDVPYPARGLHAGGLAARDSIWAPLVNAHVGSWSEETVMQANAQAFYLGVVGLLPRYTQNASTGRVEVGFDKTQASPVQIQQLVDILKKEKIRWHSDRLGRRNGGKSGPNEALQKDERARAVFHAVCELMERTQ